MNAESILLLESIITASESPRSLALLRIEHLNEDDNAVSNCDGLANELVRLLQEALDSSDVSRLMEVLNIIKDIETVDITLSEEVARSKGFRKCLDSLEGNEEASKGDDITSNTDIQELATEILGYHDEAAAPFERFELQSRLPLVFEIPQHEKKSLKIMVQQVTSDEETDTHDVGYVMWPSAVMLSHFITCNPSIVLDNISSDGTGCKILEIGAGCGLVGLTAATLLKQYYEQESNEDESSEADRVILTDYLPAVIDNMERNITLNDLDNGCATATGLDFFDQPGNGDSTDCGDSQSCWIDMDSTEHPQVDLILAADVIVYSNDATMVANTIQAALIEGGKAIVITNENRFGVEGFPDACENVGLDITMTKMDADSSNDSDNDMKMRLSDLKQTNYNEQHYSPVMFTIEKPMS